MKKFRYLFGLLLLIPLLVAGCEVSFQDTLSAPASVTVETGGYIVFTEVSAADYYVIKINNDEFSVFSNNRYLDKYTLNGVNYYEYDASSVFTLGSSYSVKVKAVADGMKDSSYTSADAYVHTTPVSQVTDIQINGSVLTWSTVDNATSYIVKVVSPEDSVTSDDVDSVTANTDLTSYSFSTNKFDFGKILNSVGVYKFYINAVSSSLLYSESGYTEPVSYTYYKTLSSTTTGEVYKVSEYDSDEGEYVDSLHVMAVVDSNAKFLTLTIDSTASVTKEIVATEPCFEISGNVIDIDLNIMFQDETGVDISLDNLATHTLYITTSAGDGSYYYDSEASDTVSFTLTERLASPVVTLAYDTDSLSYVASFWSKYDYDTSTVTAYDTTYVSKFVAYLVTTSGVTTQDILTTANNTYTISGDFLGVFVQAVGVGNYLTSYVSNIVSALDTAVTDELSVSIDSYTLSWTALDGAVYVLDLDGEVETPSTNSFDLSTLGDLPENVTLIYCISGYKPYVISAELSYSITLAAPTFSTTQGFVSSSNPYLLTFTGSEHAVGYYVYINGVKYDHLFTSTTIDLSNYFSKEGEYTTYTVQVQAVGDNYSYYKASALSVSKSVAHTQTLATPEFYKVNGADAPVVKDSLGNYWVYFYGVANADSYIIQVNFNAISVALASSNSTSYLYKVNVTSYMKGAGNYEIMVCAISESSNKNSSSYNYYSYTLTLQLDTVTNIKVTESDETYTLSFDLQTNAESYSIRIEKINDSTYAQYLQNLGLSNPFTVYGSADISKYIQQAGIYYIYVTAIANSNNGYYGDSAESSYVAVTKLQSLAVPTDFSLADTSKNTLTLSWTGDTNADYYTIIVTDPNSVSTEYKSYSTSYNISDSFSIEGDYYIKVKSVITANSAASATYESSSFSDADYYYEYLYTYTYDYERYAVYFASTDYDFKIDNVSELLGVLWYHYLYSVDSAYYLNLYITPDSDTETAREAVIRLATEATSAGLYNFDSDTKWTAFVEEESTSNGDMFAYLCQKLLGLYPATANLSWGKCVNTTTEAGTTTSDSEADASFVFKVYYANSLSVDVTATDSAYEKVLEEYLNLKIYDYTNSYTYLGQYSRRSSSTSFAIDSCESMDVTTTEQLLMAVQYGKKPNFVGDSAVAEEVYANAKAVLLAIVNDTMTDLEKVTAIFDWLSYAMNVNLYANNTINDTYLVTADISVYGNRSIYYLENVFYGLTNSSYGSSDGEFYFGFSQGWATSESLAKAFTLMCAIEGIESRVVYGSYTTNEGATVSHAWNKVKIATSSASSAQAWYSIDIMFSDGVYDFGSLSSSYYISSHTYFLVTDTLISNISIKSVVSNVTYTVNTVAETNSTISSIPMMTASSCAASTNYDYYYYSSMSMTADEINASLFSNKVSYLNNISDVKYSLRYAELDDNETYQLYGGNTQYFGCMQSYILNVLIYGGYLSGGVSGATSTVEFSVASGSATNANSHISSILSTLNDLAKYSLTGTVSSVSDSGSGYTYFVIALSVS